MCGIAGIYYLDGKPVETSLLERMGRVMHYRGPDDAGTYLDGSIGLTARRLSIIDLSSAGHQPMSNESETLWLVFNGEVYNYREIRAELSRRGHSFYSNSDSEVVLRAYEEYGPACTAHFNGMFAIAIWDSVRRRLWLARDRLGVKPLYYFHDGTKFLFGSEIKVLREAEDLGRRARPEAIAQYLSLGYSVDDGTWFEGIRKLMPGCSATVDPSGFTISQYWDPIDRYADPQPQQHAPERIRELLKDSVRLRLRSDVPIGAHLSGGLDSTSVVALMSQQSEAPIHTFSGAFREGGEYDERPFIHAAVRSFHTIHHEVEPDGSKFPETIRTLIWHMDEPAAGPGLFPQFEVCRLTASHGVKVVNGGQGGDEIFGGYPKYLRAYLRQALGHGGGATVGRDAALRQAPVMFRQVWSKRRLKSVLGRLLSPHNGYHPDFASRLDGYRAQPSVALSDPLAAEMYGDLRYYLPALLQVEDRTSMAVSIESRTPFLDYRLVELGASIPAAQKMQGGELKHELRRAMQDLLPPEIVARRDKRGFPTPIGIWFRGEVGGWVKEILFSPAFLEKRVFSSGYLTLLLRLHRSGLVDASGRLWAALNVALWFDQFQIEPTW